MRRRQVLASVSLLGCGCLARNRTPEPGAVSLTPVATGLQEPVAVEHSPVEDGVFFVGDRYGWVRRIDDDGVQAQPVVDVTDDLVEIQSWEQGLLGLALHPRFGESRKLYVRYSGRLRDGMSPQHSHTFVLLEVTLDETFESAVGAETRTLLEFPEPGARHNGGGLAFDEAGNLLVTVGDGGDQADAGQGHAKDWYDPLPGGNGQDITENLLGSVLRIDVDARADGKPYGIPTGNPLTDEEGLPEQYAWGFRNPYALTVHDDDVYVTDVGEDWYEEVNVLVAGGNYGWNIREGDACYQKTGDPDPDLECPSETPDGEPLRSPVIEFPHDSDEGSTALVGGEVYRSDELPFLHDSFVFGEVLDGPQLFAANRKYEEDGNWK